MNERIIELTEINPKDFFGAQNSTIEQLKKYFPKIKIVARGSKLKIYGESDILDEFEIRLDRLIKYFNRYNKLDENSIERILTSNGNEEKTIAAKNAKEVLVHGVSGKLIKAQTTNQRKMVSLMAKNDMLFAVGPAGTGKTYTAVALAVKALKEKEIDWLKITVFHLDEYKGISDQHPASFRKYLKERILDEVAPKKIHFLNGDAEDLEKEMENYSAALKAHPIDVACIGIGENGHIALNDPPVADFEDPKLVKLVTLDDACRNQQLGEGWFPTFDDVPKQALTQTIPAIMRCKVISCVVPDARKAQAVHDTLYNEINTACPATILRTHPETMLFLDTASAAKIRFDRHT